MKTLAVAIIFFLFGYVVATIVEVETKRRKKMIVTKRGELKEIETE